MPTRRPPARTLAVVLAALWGAACAQSPRAGSAESGAVAAGPDPAAASATPPACAGNDGGLRVADGFCATLVADSLGAARHLVVAPNGDLFVNVQPARSGGGRPGVVALRDADRDGRAETIERFGAKGGTGIALDGGFLYQDIGDAIVRWPLAAGALTPGGAADTVVSGFPTGGHAARNFVVMDGALHVNVGSQTNACQVADRQAGSKGHDPCTELETRAGIWRFDAGRTGQRFTPQARFATGIRNAVALARGPDGALWAAPHGRDQLHQNWPALFTEQQNAELPAEELMRVAEGSDFGWPYCYYDAAQRKRVLAPEYGGDGREVGRCAGRADPAMAFPAHWAPNALLFLQGTSLPAKYRDGALIAFHGSWNRAPLPQQGFRVVWVPFTGGRPAGTFETFAELTAPVANETSREGRFRPSGLAQGPDGAIYITDDARGAVWRVTAR